MPGAFKDKKLASKAGSHRNGGKHKKTLQWEALSEKFTGAFATKVIKHLETLSDDDMDKFMSHYKELLNYFKPKMQSTQIKSEGAININIISEQTDIIKKL